MSNAAKRIGKAGKSLAKAQDQVAAQNGAKAMKSLEKVAPPLIEAAHFLNPQPLGSP